MLKTLAAAAVIAGFALLASTAHAVDRPPMKSCGDFIAANGLHFDDVLARRVTCRRARQVARRAVARCGGDDSFCRADGFRCVVGQVAPELRLARCSKFREGDPLFKTIRFEFGS